MTTDPTTDPTDDREVTIDECAPFARHGCRLCSGRGRFWSLLMVPDGESRPDGKPALRPMQVEQACHCARKGWVKNEMRKAEATP